MIWRVPNNCIATIRKNWKNYFIKEIDKYELMSQKQKKICTDLDYSEHLLILASAVTGYVLIFAFFSWHSCRYCKFYSKIKNLCNNCRN